MFYVQHSHLHRFYLKTAPHHAKKSKEMATPTDKGADRVCGPMWRETWVIGQAHETEGSYPRPRGATVGRSRCLLPTALRGRA